MINAPSGKASTVTAHAENNIHENAEQDGYTNTQSDTPCPPDSLELCFRNFQKNVALHTFSPSV